MYIGVFMLVIVTEVLSFWTGLRFVKGRQDDKEVDAVADLLLELDRSEKGEMGCHKEEWFDGAIWMYGRLCGDD